MSAILRNPDLNGSAPRTGLLLVGHGSRDAAGNAEFEDLVARYRAAHPELDVSHGYVEIAEPSLAVALSTLAARNTRVIVVPLFLFAAGHIKNDIPLSPWKRRGAITRTRAILRDARSFGRASQPGRDRIRARCRGPRK